MKVRARRRPSDGEEGSSEASGGKKKQGGIGNAALADKIAVKGMSGGGSDFPYLDKIQQSFGPDYDISGARAHKGSKAKDATDALGAMAATRGAHTVFDGPTDLFTAAHEATHALLQSKGEGPSGGLGQSGDGHEKHADAVAQRVVSGESAAPLLAQMAGPSASVGQSMGGEAGVQMRENPQKEVSATAMKRLGLAQQAIDHTKGVLSEGAGNQVEALRATKFNSYFRLAAMRDPAAWIIDPSVYPLAQKYPDALTAAKADLARGGNCGEHAMIAFDYLRMNAASDIVNRCDKQGLDHAFIVMGDTEKEKDEELVVSDPWPTQATACLWEDHFAYTSDRSKLNIRNTVTGDDEDVKAAIAKGLQLSPKGEAMVQYAYDEKKTEEAIKEGTSGGDHPWIWQHPDAAADKYEYVGPEEEKPEPEKEEPAKEEPVASADTSQQDSGWQRFIRWIRSFLS